MKQDLNPFVPMPMGRGPEMIKVINNAKRFDSLYVPIVQDMQQNVIANFNANRARILPFFNAVVRGYA